MTLCKPTVSFSTLPDELISYIGLTAGLLDRSGPVTSLARLASVDQRCHGVLSPEANPSLYAALFVDRYDVAAIARRYGPSAVSAPALTTEFIKRVEALTRLRRQVRRGQLHTHEGGHDQLAADLWLLYLILLEHGPSARPHLS
jgi:hypothetical protein